MSASASGSSIVPGSSKQSTRKGMRRGKTGSVNGGNRRGNTGVDRTVRRLRLSKALTIPDTTSVADACRRMATRRTDAALLTDSTGLLCGIVTDRDLSLKVVGEGLPLESTTVAAVMTRNPVYVTIESSAVDALQKMVQGRFRHLPVVENGEVVALLDITKCLYDAIARMEKAAEKGNAMAAALEGVERQFGNTLSAPANFIDTFRDKMFRPTLGSLVGDQTKLALVQGTDAVFVAARKMRELRVSSVIVTGEGSNKPRGILTSKDILMRVMALGLSPEETMVEKVMTPNPECASLDTTIVDALHTMHDGKFLHLPLVDRDSNAVACVDVIQLTHGAVKTAVGNTGGTGEQAESMMQRFWDSALALEPADPEDDTHSIRSSEFSEQLPVDRLGGGGSHMGSPAVSFQFKMEDKKKRMQRFNCGTESLTELSACIAARLGSDYNSELPPAIMYIDEDGDKVQLGSDEDLAAAVQFARTSQAKSLKLQLEFPYSKKHSGDIKTKPNASEGSIGTLAKLYMGYYAPALFLASSVACVGFVLGSYWKRSGS